MIAIDFGVLYVRNVGRLGECRAIEDEHFVAILTQNEESVLIGIGNQIDQLAG